MLIGRNELCLCGSGKKFKKCCWNLINIKKKTIEDSINNICIKQAIDEVYKKAKKSECLYPNCSEKTINSHTVQKNGILKLLSENNQVCHNFVNLNRYSFKKLTENDLNNSFIIHKDKSLKIGDYCINNNLEFFKDYINNVSTFKGFCNYHDSLIFGDIEFDSLMNITFSNSDKEVFLYCYRLFAYFYTHEEIKLKISQTLFKNNINYFYNKKCIKTIKADINSFNKLTIEKEKLDNELKKGTYDFFESNHIVLNKKIYFCSMTILPLLYKEKVTLSYLFVIPEMYKTHIYFCKKKEDNDIENNIKEDLAVLNTKMLTNLILLGNTKIIITPSKIELIQNNIKYSKLLLGSDFLLNNKELRKWVYVNLDKSFGVDLFNL